MGRVEEYQRADGSYTSSRSARQTVMAARVVLACADSYIPSSYFTGTARHESNFCTNERDTEASGFQSFGIFQVSKEECDNTGYSTDEVLGDEGILSDACSQFIALAESRVPRLAALMNSSVDDPSPTLWAFLAVYHNQGWGGVLRAQKECNLDWAKYRELHRGEGIVSYGDDCIPGGVILPSAPGGSSDDSGSTLSPSGAGEEPSGAVGAVVVGGLLIGLALVTHG